MITKNFTHICYADESNWNSGQYRSICTISLPLENLEIVKANIGKSLLESNVSEFKWKKLDSAKYRYAAEKIIKFIIEAASKRLLRVDVIIWNTQDSRHTIELRDDEANLGRMYFHLLKNVLNKRWDNKAVWHLCPDEHNQINWDTLHEVLDYKSVIKTDKDLYNHNTNYRTILKRVYQIEKISPSKSHEEVLVQVSDLFAGMAWFSKENFDSYKNWFDQNDNQLSFFKIENNNSLSNSQKERFPIMKYFRDECRKNALGVSLETYKAFTTKDPSCPINFWWYQSQSEKDKAPIKSFKR
jgi:hypothetical protein